MIIRRTLFLLPGWILFFIVPTGCSVEKTFRSAEKDLFADKVMQSAHVGISVYDATSGKFIYDHAGDKYFVPASNIKIPTCYAAMKYLGDSLTAFRYVMRHDTIVIAGAGNPDFLHPDFKEQPALDFLKKFRHVILSVQPYEEFLGSGWAWDDYKDYYMAQRSELPVYGNIATFKWLSKDQISIMPSLFRNETTVESRGTANGFRVNKSFDANKFQIIGGTSKSAEVPFNPYTSTIASLLADTLGIAVGTDADKIPLNAVRVRSRPVDSILVPMMHRSDNFFAEQMLLMVSQEKLGTMSDEKIIDTLLKTDFASLPQLPRWVDGSGLSRYNLFTPQDFVFILDKMRQEFGMERISRIFPTGGKGTLANYYQEEAGQVFAKTGTLSGVVSLSGFVYTKKGKLLIFSVLVNNHNGAAADVRHAVERFVRRLR